MRKSREEVKQLCTQFGTDRLWSWSRINSVHNSLYEHFLKYISYQKEDRNNSIYVVTGGLSHDIIEKFYNNEIMYDDMLSEFEDGWVAAYEIAEMKFDRNDSVKNKSIADKYYRNMVHFFKNHNKITQDIVLEQFITVKIGEEYCQGYVDALVKDEDGNYTIVDWKTSSIYKGDKAKNECGQLILYAIALNQMGVPFNKIRVCWNFLKYQHVKIKLKNGNVRVREIERCALSESLQANAKMWLKHEGYSEDEILSYLDEFIQTNDITCLPKEVQDKFEFNDCYVYVDITEELLNKWETFIIDTTKMLREKEKEYAITKNESIWMESLEEVEKQSYYFSNLCSYSATKHKPYGMYLNKKKRYF